MIEYPHKIITSVLILSIISTLSCSGPDQKKKKFFESGKNLYEQGDYKRAGVEFKNVLQIDPKYTEAYYMLGLVEFHQAEFKRAFQNFSKTIELEPEHINANLELAKMFMASKAKDKVWDKLNLIFEKEPENQNALLLKSGLYLVNKEYTKAKLILEGLLKKGNTDPKLYVMLSSVYNNLGEEYQSEEILKRGIEKNENSEYLRKYLIQFYIRNKKMDKAVEQQKQLVTLNKDQIKHKYNLAAMYWQMGAREKANEIIDGIVLSAPDREESYAIAVRFNLSAKQFDSVEKTLRVGIKRIPKSYILHLMLSNYYADQQKNVDKAIATLNTALGFDRDPENPKIIEVKNALAKLYFARNDLDNAKKYVGEVLKVSPKNIEARYLKGKISLRNRNGLDAVSCFRTVVAERPAFIEGYLLLADAHMMNDQIDLSLETLQTAKRLSPENVKVLRAIAIIYKIKKDDAEVESYLQKIVSLEPEKSGALADLGDFYLGGKSFGKAEQQYALLKLKKPEIPLGYLRLSQLYTEQKDIEKAVKIIEEGVAAIPDSKILFSSLIQLYIKSEKQNKAIALCENRFKKNPDDAFTLNMMGKLYAVKKDLVKSESFFNKAIALKPMWMDPYNNLAKLYLIKGSKGDAITKFEDVLKKDPDNVQAGITLSAIYTMDKSFDHAKRVYETMLAANKDIWIAANNLAYIISEYYGKSDEDMKEALVWAEKALQLRPDEALIADTLGWIHYKLGNITQASELIDKALEKVPDNSVLNYHMGMVHYKKGDIKAAIAKLEKSLDEQEKFEGREEAEKILAKLKS